MRTNGWYQDDRRGRIAGCLALALLWTVALLMAGTSLSSSYALTSSGVVTTGTVIRVDHGSRLEAAYVRFTTKDGATVTATTGDLMAHEVGDEVRIRYAASNPKRIQDADKAPWGDVLKKALFLPVMAGLTALYFRRPSWRERLRLPLKPQPREY